MRIAVTSQNRLTVTGHAGRCQRFWVYEVEGLAVHGRRLVEVDQAHTFHANHHEPPAGLEGMQVLISGGMGEGLVNRLKALGVEGIVTSETDPDRAVAGFVLGRLPTLAPHAHGHGHHQN